MTKHLMIGPIGNSDFSFPSVLKVSGKQNSLFLIEPCVTRLTLNQIRTSEAFKQQARGPNSKVLGRVGSFFIALQADNGTNKMLLYVLAANFNSHWHHLTNKVIKGTFNRKILLPSYLYFHKTHNLLVKKEVIKTMIASFS